MRGIGGQEHSGRASAGGEPDASSGDMAGQRPAFTDLFEVEQIQAIQDTFSAATGVASIITEPDGTPITRPSNFCRLCNDIIRGTEKGLANCLKSDAVIGRPNPSGPVIQPCLSGGLWDAGASISAGGEHVANWLIGQVRNETQDEAAMLAYADEIGVDRAEFKAALGEVPAMPLARFELVAQSLYLIANELSLVAYQSLQQERLINEVSESRALLAAILDAVPQSIFVKDAEGVYLACNQPFASDAGVEGPERIIGKTDYDLPWAKEGADAYRKDDREVMRSALPKRHIIEQIRTADGTVMWADTTKVPLVDRSGAPYAVLGVFEDITERKSTEAALHESYEMLANLTDQVPGVVYQYRLYSDGRSRFPFSSRGMNDIYEYSPEAVREDATPVFGRLHPEDYDRVAADIFESARTLEPFHCEFRVVLPRQGLRWRLSDALPQRMEDGSTLWHGIISDATDRVLAEEELARQAHRIEQTLTSVIDIASTIVETRDPYTAGHQRRVAELAAAIAQDLGMSGPEVADVRVAGLLHDVGKVRVPAEILGKPGAISPIEWDIIHSHAQAGYEIVDSAHIGQPIAELVYQHHERCDGTGYPRGLTSDQILLGAKVLAVADVVEAMSSHRPYRATLGIEAALAEIESGAGRLYDADVAGSCIALFREKGFRLSPAAPDRAR